MYSIQLIYLNSFSLLRVPYRIPSYMQYQVLRQVRSMVSLRNHIRDQTKYKLEGEQITVREHVMKIVGQYMT